MTTLSSRRPCDWRWKVDAIWADSVGLIMPGRNATRNFSRSVTSVSIAQVSHASSHQVPVGVSAASNPSCSALRAICPRYFTDGGSDRAGRAGRHAVAAANDVAAVAVGGQEPVEPQGHRVRLSPGFNILLFG